MNKLLTAFTACVTVWYMNAAATPSSEAWIPSPDIQAFKKLHIGWDAYVGTNSGGLLSNGGLTIGVLPFSKLGLEIGIDYRDASGIHKDPVYFNAKLGIPEGSLFKHSPAIAVGGYDFGTRKDITTYNLVYGLLGETIWKLGRLSVGGFKGAVGSDDALFGVIGTNDKDDKGVMLSWDRTISEISDKLWLCVDYQSGKSAYGAFSFGGSWNFAPNVGLFLGYNIYNDNENIKPTFTVQVDINAF